MDSFSSFFLFFFVLLICPVLFLYLKLWETALSPSTKWVKSLEKNDFFSPFCDKWIFVILFLLFICVFSFFISEKQIQILFQEPCAYFAIIWFVKALIYWLSCIPFSFCLFCFCFLWLVFYVPMHSMCPTWGWWHYNQLPICLMCPKGQCWSQVMTDNLHY